MTVRGKKIGLLFVVTPVVFLVYYYAFSQKGEDSIILDQDIHEYSHLTTEIFDYTQCTAIRSRGKGKKYVFYSHVTKAGGTSVYVILQREAERRGQTFEGNSRVLYKRTGIYSKANIHQELARRSLWASELPFRNFEKIVSHSAWFKIVMLRDPLERFNSYRQMRANTPKAVWDEYRSPAPSVKRGIIRSLANLQCDFVSRDKSSCDAKSLNFWELVLLFEEFNSSIALICIFLKISDKNCCLPFVNMKKRDSFPLPELSSSDKRYFKKMNKQDIMLYVQARRKFYTTLSCLKSEVNSYLSNMKICTNVSGVKINPGSQR